MHESSIARHLLAAVLDAAAGAEKPGGVLRVRGWVAESEALSREALVFHFAAHALGTLAEGAQLDLRLVRLSARCNACRLTYEPDHVLLCPACGSTVGAILGHPGVAVEDIEVDGA